MKVALKKISGLGLSVAIVFAFAVTVQAQTPISPRTPSTATDTAMIFQPSHPLIQNANELAKENPNTWGLDASFSDYGFGGGAFLGHSFSPDITGMLSLDFGTAEGSREFDLLEVNKINRIFVIPIMASLQYRVFRDALSDNLRPYVAVGAGPVIAMTTPYADDFFSAFGSAKAKVVPGGYIGLGANFGMDPKTNFGASLRYFIIPYPGAIQSTTTESLTNLSGLFLTVSYGFNF
ncbi:MAG TPA: outer membrane beta-barrel protein [Candidatus Kapabacteria bacterium]|nr:outer membrane beta-barrel protein [Candidatus Kapabacteria bacterium]